MQITDALANLYYDVLVMSVGSPDIDYLRWSFVYSLCDLELPRYRMESRLGQGGLFSLDQGVPLVSCDHDLDSEKEAMVQLANHLIQEIHLVIPAITIKPVQIAPPAPARTVPVIRQQPTLAKSA